MHSTDRIPDLVRRLYESVNELEQHFPGRRFTPDGNMVGSLGEVLAEYRYGLKLFRASVERHDAEAQDGRLVQIKATQGTGGIGLRSEPEHLIVLQIKHGGSAEEVFDGPGVLAWNNAGRMQNNGQCRITLSTLRRLMMQAPRESKLPTVNHR